MTTSISLLRPTGTPAFAQAAPASLPGHCLPRVRSRFAGLAQSLRGFVTHAVNACADIVLGAAALGVDMPLVAAIGAVCAVARRLATATRARR
jgi:hypothetical protein